METNMAASAGNSTRVDLNATMLKFVDPLVILGSINDQLTYHLQSDQQEFPIEAIRCANVMLKQLPVNLDRPTREFSPLLDHLMSKTYYSMYMSGKVLSCDLKDIGVLEEMTKLMMVYVQSTSKFSVINELLDMLHIYLQNNFGEKGADKTAAKISETTENIVDDRTNKIKSINNFYKLLAIADIVLNELSIKDISHYEQNFNKILEFFKDIVVNHSNKWKQNQLSFIVSKLLPKIFMISPAFYYDICTDIEKQLIEHKLMDNACLNYLPFLCSFVNLQSKECHNAEPKDLYTLLEKPCFIKLIQCGIAQCDPTNKKRSMYIIDYLILRNSNSDVCKYLQEFCLIIETLPEKQVHLIGPLFPRIKSLIEKSVNSNSWTFGYSWILIIFKLLLKHDNKIVVTWGIESFLEVPFDEHVILHEDFQELFYYTVIPALNNMFLFESKTKSLQYEEFTPVSTSFKKFFININNKLKLEGNLYHFYFKFLHHILKSCLQTVPLMYIFAALSDIPSKFVLNEMCVAAVIDIISIVIKSNDKLLIDGVLLLLLQTIFHLCNPEADTSSDSSLTSKFQNIKFAMILLDAECTAYPVEYIKKSFSEVENILCYLNSRSYVRSKTAQHASCILKFILKETKTTNDIKDLNNDGFIEKLCNNLISKCLHEVLKYVTHKITSHEMDEEDFCVDPFINLLDEMFLFNNDNIYKQQLLSFANIWISVVNQVILKGQNAVFQSVDTNKVTACVKCLALGSSHMTEKLTSLNGFADFFSNWNLLFAPSLRTKNSSGSQLKGYYADLWTIMHSYVKFDKCWFNTLKTDMLVKETLCALEMSSSKTIVILMDILAETLPQIPSLETDIFEECIIITWKIVTEHRGNEFFESITKAFVRLFYNKKFLNEDKYSPLLRKQTEDLYKFGEIGRGVAPALISHVSCIQHLYPDSDLFSNHIHILTNALSFGPIPRKDQNDLFQDKFSRSQATELILFLSSNTNNQVLIKDLTSELVKRDKEIVGLKGKFFLNSKTHRLRQRLWQSIIILQPNWSKNYSLNMLNHICDSLTGENQPTSIKYFQEWTAILILLKYSEFSEHFQIEMRNASERRVGSISSFLSIMNHTIMAQSNLEQVLSHVMCWIPHIIHWCMSQNFVVKIYALTVLHNIQLLLLKENISSILEPYKLVLNGFSLENNYGNTKRNMEKLLADFYFFSFNPIHHYSLETIFKELPKLSHATNDDWISPEWFQRYASDASQSDVHGFCIFNKDDGLLSSQPSSWNDKKSEPFEEFCSLPHQDNIQKKFLPWKQNLLDNGLCFDSSNRKHVPPIPNEGLIVVASLLDKLPNVGGLCRTCEVFGANQFVMGNINNLENKEFSSLSVTAENWIPIIEVKPCQLAKYLSQKKDEGYLIAGAEQAADSVSLPDVIFPEKVVLLLGNEKQGIPVNLIQLLDICIEIPQQGVIRSLNVHVVDSQVLCPCCSSLHINGGASSSYDMYTETTIISFSAHIVDFNSHNLCYHIMGSYSTDLSGHKNYPLEEDGNVTFINGDPMINPNLFEGDIVGIDPAEDRLQIENAMKHIETATSNCIQFKKRDYEVDYISIFRGSGCYSNVGRIGGEQKVSLGRGCEPFGTSVHELTHAIGFFHEQSRNDRDSYITVQYNNIARNMWPQFDKTNTAFAQPLTHFDFNSVMLYGSYAFSNNQRRTMIKKDGSDIISPHIKNGLSSCDVKRIGLAYNCPTAAASSC
ncbi:putative methyltransferase TARBP1 [Nymphon striatum]|nr:putative methyltransferase TARBP1 [Nymphon striatum]